MAPPIAVTVIGNDRSGIVAGIARALYELGCNLEDVTSTILRGHFAMMLVVRAPNDLDATSLENRLSAVASELDLVVTARPVAEAATQFAPPTHIVSVYGADKPGIVFRVSAALAELGANITDLTSRLIGEDGTPVYALMLEVAAPEGSDLDAALASLRADLGVEVTVRAAESDLL